MPNTPDTKTVALSFQHRLSAYSALAAAGACAVAVPPNSAEASVIYSGPLNLSVSVSVVGSYFDLATFAFGASYGAVNGGDATAPVLNLWGTGSSFSYLYPGTSTTNRFVGATSTVQNLTLGMNVGPTATFGTTRAPSALGATGNWTAGTTGYLGIQFLNGATTEYGWVQIFFPGTPTAGNPIRIIDAAFENTGAAIFVGQGQVPEPGTISLLVAGVIGAGALTWRRRRAA